MALSNLLDFISVQMAELLDVSGNSTTFLGGLWSWFANQGGTLANTIIILTAVSALTLYVIRWLFFRPKFEFEVAEIESENKLGIQVRCKNRNVKEVEVYCDSLPQTWEERGTPKQEVNLYKGKPPIPFFPYEASLKVVGESTTAGSIATIEMAIQERVSKRLVGTGESLSIPRGATGKFEDTTDFIKFTPKIRLVGEQIDRIKDYPVQVGVRSLVVVGSQVDSTHFDYHWEGNLFLIPRKRQWWHFW